MRIDDFNGLNDGATVGQIRGKDIERQHDHRKIRPRDLDEQLVVARPYFPDLATIDDRRKRQDVLPSIPQNGQTRMAGNNVPVLQTLGMHHQNFRQCHDGLHPQRGEPCRVALNHLIGDRKLNVLELIQTDRDGLSLVPINIRKFFLRLYKLG